MTNKEAIKILKANEERKLATDYCRIKDMAIAALEKQVPKRPVKTSKEIVCPNCKTLVGSSPYCRYCGQKIDWSDYI